MPDTWEGHPLQKCHPARATEMAPYQLPESKQETEQLSMQFKPEEWGLDKTIDDDELLFLNLGPQHPGTHGILRLVVQLDGENIMNVVPDIGFHHRGAEKMGERQSWHSYIPYTDRVEYLGGVMNNFPYVMAVEKLAGIKVRDKDFVVESSLRRAGLWNEVQRRLKSPGGALSGGQQQRLCIARSLAVEPSVLLMDEPCSALDPTSTRRVEETIAELQGQVTIVIVTHNMQQAQRVSKNCAFFLAAENTPGHIVEAGPTERVFDSPADPRTADYVHGRFG